MTPGARIAAAIAILDQIGSGLAAEQALTRWARASRFAGAKDRAAIRDHVFDVLRQRLSLGNGDGRALMVQLALRSGWDVAALFSGDGHAPAPVTETERNTTLALTDAARVDVPEWLWPIWQRSLGPDATETARAQQARADVFLRVNLRRGTIKDAQDALMADDIATMPVARCETALRVTENARRLKTSTAFTSGLVELQDTASQLAMARLDLSQCNRILDYCAGGGGKSLALADRTQAEIVAHDIDPARTADIAPRAKRAGAKVKVCTTQQLTGQGRFDLVLCDAPCSGSGTWRRAPEAKWRLTLETLESYAAKQLSVLQSAESFVAKDGHLAYATCSVLDVENDGAIAAFLQASPQWELISRWQRVPDSDGDGFYLAVMKRKAT